MNTGDLLTVKEFAKAAGVSRQTVYNRLDKDLTAYLTEIDSVKYIDKAALSLFVSNLDSQVDSQIDSGFDKNLTGFDSNLTAVLQQSIDLQAATITTLQSQLAAKDDQIAALQKTIDSLTAALTAAQTLQAMEKQERLKLTDQTGATAPEPSPTETDNSSRAARSSGLGCTSGRR